MKISYKISKINYGTYFTALIFSISLIFIQSCSDNKNEEAKQEFEKAIEWYEMRKRGHFMEYRKSYLDKTYSILINILKKYPKSDIAIRLNSGEQISGIALNNIKKQLEDIIIHIKLYKEIKSKCFLNWNNECLIRLAQLNLKYTNHEVARGIAQKWIAIALARNKNFSASEKLASQIFPMAVRARALGEIGEVLAKTGDAKEAKRLFELALGIALSRIYDERLRDSTLKDIVQSEVNAEFYERSLKTINRMQKEWQKQNQYFHVFKILARREQLRDALIFLKELADGTQKAEALAFIAAILAAKGERDKAARYLKRAIDMHKSKVSGGNGAALVKIAVAQAALDALDQALVSVSRISDKVNRDQAFVEIVDVRLRRGDLSSARRIAGLIVRPFRGAAANSKVAIALFRSGQQAEAKATYERSLGYLRTPKGQSAFELEAMGAANATLKIWQLSQIGLEQAEAGNEVFANMAFSLADQILIRIKSKRERISSLLTIANAKRKLGREIESDSALTTAQNLSKALIEDACQNDEIQIKLALALAESRRFKDAGEVINRTKCWISRVKFYAQAASNI